MNRSWESWDFSNPLNHSDTLWHALDTMPGWKYFHAVGGAIESILGTCGNLLVLLAFIKFPNMRTTGNYFIVNLSIADLLVTAIAQPSNVAGALLGSRPFVEHATLCTIIGTLCAVGCIASPWNICMVAVNRYVTICHHTLYEKIYSKRNTLLMCFGVWVLIFSIHMPNHLGWGVVRFSKLAYTCSLDTHWFPYMLFYFSLGIYLPVVIAFFAYFKIFMRVRHSRFVRSRHIDPNMRRPSQKESQSMLEDINTARILFRFFVVFVLMWVPAGVAFTSGLGNAIHPGIWVMVNLLGHGNSTVNVILYATSLPQFRENFRGKARKSSVRTILSGVGSKGSGKSVETAPIGSVENGRSNQCEQKQALDESK